MKRYNLDFRTDFEREKHIRNLTIKEKFVALQKLTKGQITDARLFVMLGNQFGLSKDTIRRILVDTGAIHPKKRIYNYI